MRFEVFVEQNDRLVINWQVCSTVNGYQLPLQSQYILSLLLFLVDNGDYFKVNSEIHNINTRNKSNLHPPVSKLSVYQKGTYYSRTRVFNSLPSQIKDLSHNRNHFKHALKNFLYFHSFYTLDEYFNCNRI